MGLNGKSLGHWGVPLKGMVRPWDLPFSFRLQKQVVLLCHVLLPWYAALTEPQSSRTTRSWTTASRTVSQNKLFLFINLLSHTFCPGCLGTVILPISVSQVARITGVSHWCLACFHYFWIGSHFYAQADLDHDPPIYTSHVSGMTGLCHCTWASVPSYKRIFISFIL
jgi:hypothetical protein